MNDDWPRARRQDALAWGPRAAAAIIITLPSLLSAIQIQEKSLTGMTAGGVKGR